MKAVWNNAILAEAKKDDIKVVEGNAYFPINSIKKEYFKPSDTHTVCPWKGKASYYSIEVDGLVNEDAAWYYPNPSILAKKIKDYVAFWKGVEVVE